MLPLTILLLTILLASNGLQQRCEPIRTEEGHMLATWFTNGRVRHKKGTSYKMDIQGIEPWTSRKHSRMRSVRATTVPNALT